MRIIINGAGVAGPTLAYWLRKSGHEVVIVERAQGLRRGGYVIDFWGLGYDIAERMGLIPRIRELGYAVRELRFVDQAGRRQGGFPVEVFRRIAHDRFTSIRRSDLAATIYAATEGEVETIFGDSVTEFEELGDGLRIQFEHAAARECDLLIGADGLHSRVRERAFGAQDRFEVSLGYHVAAFEVGGYRPREELVYISHGLPGRQVSRFSMRDDRTLFLFVFRNEHLPAGEHSNEEAARAAIARVFADVGWECPAILDALRDADGVYFDTVSQIRMDRWTSGRTALIGDAAACVSLMAGEGTGLAMLEAYVLAGELRASPGDHRTAFARYEERLRPFLATKQANAAKFASSFAPASAFGIALRNAVTRLFGIPGVAGLVLGRELRDDFALPDYGL